MGLNTYSPRASLESVQRLESQLYYLDERVSRMEPKPQNQMKTFIVIIKGGLQITIKSEKLVPSSDGYVFTNHGDPVAAIPYDSVLYAAEESSLGNQLTPSTPPPQPPTL